MSIAGAENNVSRNSEASKTENGDRTDDSDDDLGSVYCCGSYDIDSNSVTTPAKGTETYLCYLLLKCSSLSSSVTEDLPLVCCKQSSGVKF